QGEQPPPSLRRRRWGVAAGAVLALALVAFVAFRLGSGSSHVAAHPSVPASPSASAPPTTAQLYASVAPSVVTVQAVEGDQTVASGTGVIANAAGIILTALHVVKGATSVRV